MADEKLTELPVVSLPLLGTDQLYLVRADTSYQTTVDDILSLIPPSAAVWGSITGDINDQDDLNDKFSAVQSALDNKADNGPATSSGLTMNSGFVLGRFSPGNGALEELSVTGTGDVVRQVSPALITPNLDTPSAINLTNATAVPAGQVVGIIPIANLASGTPNGAKFIRDDGTLAVPAGSGGTVTAVSSANGDLTVATGTTTPVLTVVSAPKLTTARNINGTAFDGTGDITVTAAAGTLTGTTLNATVVTSSLTAVGDLTTGSIGTGFVVKGVTMTLGSDANYDVYYRNSSGVLTRLANGTTGQFLAATTGAAPSWGTPSGTGTVTNTGTLTSNSVVLGNGSADVKVVAGITTDGTSQINLGVASTTLGKLKLFGNTSGDVTIQPSAVAGTATVVTLPNASSTLPIFGQLMTFAGPTAARTVTMPDASFTVARTDAANTFTGVQTMTSPAFLTTTTLDGVNMAPQILQNSQSGNYTCVLSDANKQICVTANTGNTITIPANSSVAYPIGTTLVFVIRGTRTVTIAITTDTLNFAGGTTGSRTLTGNGMACALKIASTEWMISGTNLS